MKKLSQLTGLFCLIVLLFNLSCAPSGTYTVQRVVDGDTIAVAINGRTENVRYIGIDTPETKHPSKPVGYCGKEASEYNESLLRGRRIRLEYDVRERDKYGRMLAYVYAEGGDGKEVFVNAELVKAGMATILTIPPDVKYTDTFYRLQKEAREKQLGIWGEGSCRAVSGTARAISPAGVEAKDDSNCPITGSRMSDKYHDPGCKWAKKISPRNKVCFKSREEAEKKGYKPCRVCGG